jgi:hypothetical protein
MNLLILQLSLSYLATLISHFFNVNDQVSHPYEHKDKFIILYILILMLLEDGNIIHGESDGSMHSLSEFTQLLNSSQMQF